jgi:hypothetical protein
MADITVSGKFILASVSPRRIELLTLLGLQFDIVPSDVDEFFLNGETPKEHVLRLSGEKAGKISDLHPDAWVLGADTIVTINDEILGKPRTADEAREMLGKLSGQTHQRGRRFFRPVQKHSGRRNDLVCCPGRTVRQGRKLRRAGNGGFFHPGDLRFLYKCHGTPPVRGGGRFEAGRGFGISRR